MTPMLMYRISQHLSVNITTPQSYGVFSPTTQKFLDRWNGWLKLPAEITDDHEHVVMLAIVEFMKALVELDANECLLTTQIDTKCMESVSPQHNCVHSELVSMLEELPMFKVVNEHLKSNPGNSDVAKLAGELAERCPRNTKGTCQHCPFSSLNAAHFLSALLLTWPCVQCNKTNGNALRKVAMAQLSRAPPVIQNEMALMHQQWESVFKYVNKCQTGKCACKCKVSAV